MREGIALRSGRTVVRESPSKRGHKDARCLLDELPEAILTENILSRLEVSELCRLACACKNLEKLTVRSNPCVSSPLCCRIGHACMLFDREEGLVTVSSGAVCPMNIVQA